MERAFGKSCLASFTATLPIFLLSGSQSVCFEEKQSLPRMILSLKDIESREEENKRED